MEESGGGGDGWSSDCTWRTQSVGIELANQFGEGDGAFMGCPVLRRGSDPSSC
jgi:hypothetical protein